MNIFKGRLGIQQRVLPSYRARFFELMSESCTGGLSLFAGKPLPKEGIVTTDSLNKANYQEGRNVHFLDSSSPFFLCWQLGLVKWLQTWDPDSLVVEANPRYLSTRLAVRWMRQKKKPVFGWGLGIPRIGNPVEVKLRLKFFKSLDGIFSYSSRGAQEYRAFGLDNVFIVNNAVSPKPRDTPKLRRNHFEGQPQVIFVGRLQARKRVDLLIKACHDLPNSLQPQLTIVGDGPERSNLEALAKNVYPQTMFVGTQQGERLASYLDLSDIFVLPGTGGLAIQQAMSHGLPIIAAQGDGTQEDLVRPENGWQIPPGDQVALGNTLMEALSDVPKLRNKGEESYRIVKEEINLEKMVEVFIQGLSSVKPLGIMHRS